MTSAGDDFLTHSQHRVELALAAALRSAGNEYRSELAPTLLSRLYEALSYSTMAGGKRVRPALVYAAAKAIQPLCDADDLDRISAALECMHCYSLVHDDLPAMDNDDLRRGRPTCHRQYDEATAILVGDALQALAFELLCQLTTLAPATQLQLVRTLAQAGGMHGMVGGQFIDLQAENHPIVLAELQAMHQLKTGALIRAAVRMGGYCAGASDFQLAALDQFGNFIGLAFQVKDDLLDIEGSTATLGKPQGSDLARNKATYPALMGKVQARQHASDLYQQAMAALNVLGSDADTLRRLASYIIQRDH